MTPSTQTSCHKIDCTASTLNGHELIQNEVDTAYRTGIAPFAARAKGLVDKRAADERASSSFVDAFFIEQVAKAVAGKLQGVFRRRLFGSQVGGTAGGGGDDDIRSTVSGHAGFGGSGSGGMSAGVFLGGLGGRSGGGAAGSGGGTSGSSGPPNVDAEDDDTFGLVHPSEEEVGDTDANYMLAGAPRRADRIWDDHFLQLGESVRGGGGRPTNKQPRRDPAIIMLTNLPPHQSRPEPHPHSPPTMPTTTTTTTTIATTTTATATNTHDNHQPAPLRNPPSTHHHQCDHHHHLHTLL